MNEEIPQQESAPEILERMQLLAFAEKLMPQGPSGKVKNHINILAGMAEEIRNDGFEMVIDDDLTVDEMGDAGRIEITLMSDRFPEIEVPFIEEDFDNRTYVYTDKYPEDEKSLREAYDKAKEIAETIIRRNEDSGRGTQHEYKQAA